MDILPVIEETALYKMAKGLLDEYQAIQQHDYNPGLQKLLDDTIAHLEITVKEVGDHMMVAYIIQKEAVDDDTAA